MLSYRQVTLATTWLPMERGTTVGWIPVAHFSILVYSMLNIIPYGNIMLMCFIEQFLVIVLVTIVIMYEYIYNYLLFISSITIESTELTLLDVSIKLWLGH